MDPFHDNVRELVKNLIRPARDNQTDNASIYFLHNSQTANEFDHLMIDTLLPKYNLYVRTKFNDKYHVTENSSGGTVGCKSIWITEQSIQAILKSADSADKFWILAKKLNPRQLY